jgi:hypothetical protein
MEKGNLGDLVVDGSVRIKLVLRKYYGPESSGSCFTMKGSENMVMEIWTSSNALTFFYYLRRKSG